MNQWVWGQWQQQNWGGTGWAEGGLEGRPAKGGGWRLVVASRLHPTPTPGLHSPDLGPNENLDLYLLYIRCSSKEPIGTAGAYPGARV